MKDKNGTEIKTGMIVEITGAYFKSDNALYLVAASPRDPSWSGKHYSLIRISKAGKISTAKYRICFWPLTAVGGSQIRRMEARRWNDEHAAIEVKQIGNMEGAIAYFREAADRAKESLQKTARLYGEADLSTEHDRALAAHYEAVIAGIKSRMEAAAPVKASDRIKSELAELDAEYDRLAQEMVWKHPDHTNENHDALWEAFWKQYGRPMVDRKRLLQLDLEGALNQELQVGDGVTLHLWSDAQAYTIIARTEKTLTIQRDKATYAPGYKPEYIPGGFSAICVNDADQEWVYERDPKGEIVKCHWSEKLKRWQAGHDGSLRIGRGRHENYDHNF